MSREAAIHCEMNGCSREGGEMAWTAHCICGWDGEPRFGSSDAGMAHRDFRVHVIAELGHAAFYEAPVICVNCTYCGPASLLVGTDVWSGICPMCGCSGRLRPRDLHERRMEEADRA